MQGNYIILFIADKCGENAINRSGVNKSATRGKVLAGYEISKG